MFRAFLNFSLIFVCTRPGATISLLVMKTLIQKPTSTLWVVLVGLLAFAAFDSKAQQAEVSFQIFYDELAPHGRWLLHPKYGDVWAPNVQGEFTPYLTNGYWTVTQYGNTWVSNYDWGWATFHYGRWYFDEFEGWVWIPDTEWAPAWVVWRNGGGYYGWAAMSPGLNFSVSFNIFNDVPSFYWCFVPQQYVWRPYVYRYCAPRHRNVYIVTNTTYVSHCRVNNITYNYYTGPSHTEITHVTNRPVVIHHVENTNKPGRSQVSRDKITMFTPTVKRNEMQAPVHNGISRGWSKNNSDNDNAGNGRDGNGSQGNNGHGNGDQNAPGNSGGNNNGENSENSGQGNSGKGSRWGNPNSTDRFNNSNDNFENWKRSENKNVRSYQSSEIKKSSSESFGNSGSTGNNNRSGLSNSGGNSNRSFSSGNSGSSSSNTKSYTPSRSNSSSGSNRSFTPSGSGNSGGGSKSFTPSRSSSNSGSNSNKSFTPSRSSSSSSGGSKTVTPSRSSGSSSNSSSKSKSKN